MTDREYQDYLQDILLAIKSIRSFIADYDLKEFKADEKTVWAVIRGLEVIGEASKHIPNKVREKYPQIPWKDMAGMRDKVIHSYFGVNLEVVWKTITRHLPAIEPLIHQVEKDMKK
jgi:uncharacterized protein with HEPN domain